MDSLAIAVALLVKGSGGHSAACHYTTLGISMQPPEADPEGYLEFREDFHDIPREEWTDAERLIDRVEREIEEFRAR